MLNLRWSMLLMLLAAVLTLAACGGDDEAEATDDDATATEAAGDAADGVGDADGATVEVSLTEWAIEPASGAPAGEVTFVVANEGSVPHELVIIRSDEPVDALPTENTLVVEDGLDVIGEVEEFPAGGTEEGTFQFEAGRYLLICNVVGHYDLGMRTEFTVE